MTIEALSGIQIMIFKKGGFLDILRFPPWRKPSLVIKMQWPNSMKDQPECATWVAISLA